MLRLHAVMKEGKGEDTTRACLVLIQESIVICKFGVKSCDQRPRAAKQRHWLDTWPLMIEMRRNTGMHNRFQLGY
jgi:hypothetical protein